MQFSLVSNIGTIFKGRVSHFFFILSYVPLGIIYGGKIVKTGRSGLKMVKKCKNSSFLCSIFYFISSGVIQYFTSFLRGLSNILLHFFGGFPEFLCPVSTIFPPYMPNGTYERIKKNAIPSL